MTEKEWKEILTNMDHKEFNAHRRYYQHNISFELVEDVIFEIEVEDDLSERIEEAMRTLTPCNLPYLFCRL